MKKDILILILSLMLVIGINCSAIAYEETQDFAGQSIKIMMEPHPTSNALVELKSEFEEATGINVDIVIEPYDNMPEKIMLNFATKSNEWDAIHDDWVFHAFAYAKAGYLEPLNRFVEDAKLSAGFDMDDLVPKPFVEDLWVDGNLYGVPVYSDSTFLMYRKDIFEKYGLKVPETMEEMIDVCKELKEGFERDGITDIYPIILRGKRGIHMIWTWSSYFVAYGGKYFDKDMKPAFNSPEGIDATKMYLSLFEYASPGAPSYGWEENRIAFEQGKAAMTIDASVNAGFAEDPNTSTIAGKVGYAVMPKAVQYGPNISPHALYISAFSDNKEATWLFLKWAINKETQAKALDILPIPTGTSITVLNSEKYDEMFHVFKDAHIESLEVGNLDYVPKVPEVMEVTDLISLYISEALIGNMTVEEALSAAEKDVYELMKAAGYYD